MTAKPFVVLLGIVLALEAAAIGSLSAQARRASDAPDPRWKRAAQGRPIVLPADHAAHPDYQLEWWYYTGNLDAANGDRFGFQVTFFRIGVDPEPAGTSRWAVRDLFMTHVALTDARGRRYLYAERLNRAGPGWAGADADRYRVWNEDWDAGLDGVTHRLRANAVSASDGARFGLDLALEESAPPALHGDKGYSRKGSDPGNASHYYSLPRMPTRGTVHIDGRTVAVTGLSWMDHEFGTSFLEAGQIGWDWFAIQLSDGRSLMLYRFRRTDGRPDPRSSGTLVDARGQTAPVDFPQVTMTAGRTWTSPSSKTTYPVGWRVTLANPRLDLTVEAIVDQQELQTSESTGVTYWEGAVDVRGSSDGRPVTGRGYLEMTGYNNVPMSNYLR